MATERGGGRTGRVMTLDPAAGSAAVPSQGPGGVRGMRSRFEPSPVPISHSALLPTDAPANEAATAIAAADTVTTTLAFDGPRPEWGLDGAAEAGGDALAPAHPRPNRWASAARLTSHALRAFGMKWMGVSTTFLEQLRADVMTELGIDAPDDTNCSAVLPHGTAAAGTNLEANAQNDSTQSTGVCEDSSKTRSVTTEEVCERFIKPGIEAMGEQGSGSYAQLCAKKGRAELGEASIFVSHSWKYPFLDVVDELIALGKREEALKGKPVHFWIDVVMVDQTDTEALDNTFWVDSFRSAIGAIGHTVVLLAPYDAPLPVARAWCLFEIAQSLVTGVTLEAVLLGTEKGRLKAAVAAMSEDDRFVTNLMLEVDAKRAECSFERDRVRIFEMIEAMEGGFHELNVQVKAWLRGWLLEAGKGIVAEIDAKAKSSGGAEGEEGAIGDMYNSIGELLLREADYTGARDCYIKALAVRTAARGAWDPSIAETHLSLSVVERRVPNYPKAQTHVDAAAAIVQHNAEIAGSLDELEHRKVLGAQFSLDTMTAKYDEALASAEEELEITLRHEGAEHMKTVSALSSVGYAKKKLGFYKEARDTYTRAIAICETLGQGQDPSALYLYNSMALLHNHFGETEDALRYLQRCLSVKEELYGRHSEKTATTHMNIGNVLLESGKFEAALDHFQKGSAIRETIFGPEHSVAALALSHVGLALNGLGRLEEALETHRDSLSRMLAIETADKRTTAAIYNNVGKDLLDLGRHSEALEAYRTAMSLREADSGRTDLLDNTWSLYGAGEAETAMGNYAAALEYHAASLQIRRRTLREDHPNVAKSAAAVERVTRLLQTKPSA